MRRYAVFKVFDFCSSPGGMQDFQAAFNTYIEAEKYIADQDYQFRDCYVIEDMRDYLNE